MRYVAEVTAANDGQVEARTITSALINSSGSPAEASDGLAHHSLRDVAAVRPSAGLLFWRMRRCGAGFCEVAS
jgi:hypothetical protein